MPSSKPENIRFAKYVLFGIGLLSSLALIFFPAFIRDKSLDRVIESATLCMVVALVLALEDLRISLKEREDEAGAKHSDVVVRLGQLNDQASLAKIYGSLREIESTGDKVFYAQAHDAFVKIEARLKRAAEGEFHLDNVDTAALGMMLASDVEKSLDATVVWLDDPMPEAGRRQYLKLLAEAHKKRGVNVRRLFLIRKGDESSPEFLARVRKDLHDETEVRYLHVNDWVRTEGVQYPVDFGIWDGKRVWVYDPKQSTDACDRFATLLRDEASMLTYPRVFEANWKRGTELALPL
jgi:hypothetical protein